MTDETDRERRGFRVRRKTSPVRSADEGSAGIVFDLIQTLAHMVGDLERQLDSMLDLSDSFEEELVEGRQEMASTVEDLRDKMAERDRELEKLARREAQVRQERDEAVDELTKLEERLDQLLEQVGDLSQRSSSLVAERQRLLSRLRVVERQLRGAEDERDSLRGEIEESRLAMEEIRHWVSEVAATTGRYPPEE